MCGRLVRTSPVAVLRQLFDLLEAPDDLLDRYNLAPRELVPVIREKGKLEMLRWGLTLPDPKHSGINARIESLSRPIYRENLRDRRCIVVVDAFYEWRSLDGKKYPYLITREDRAPLAMAALYDATEGCAVITMPSRGVIATLHARMPVILERTACEAWLDTSTRDEPAMKAVLAGATSEGLTTYPVSSRANSPRHDEPSLLDRVAEPTPPELAKGKTLSLF